MFGKPGVSRAQLIGEANQFGDFVENLDGFSIARAFQMIGQSNCDHVEQPEFTL
jgi:hypothetical protein